MEAPALVLVPSSPLDIDYQQNSPKAHANSDRGSASSKSNSPVSSDTSDTSYTVPPSSYGISIEHIPDDDNEKERSSGDAERNSSESTIFSIYSMYSERRQTWRKSASAAAALTNGVLGSGFGHGLGKEHNNREGSRESGKGTERTSESIADSFYRAPHTTHTSGSMSVSRKSSSGSGFFAGSASASMEGGSSRHQSYNYSYSGTPAQSRPQSRPFLDASQSINLGVGVGVGLGIAVDTTELAYANANHDSHPNSNYRQTGLLSTGSNVDNVEADTNTQQGSQPAHARSQAHGPEDASLSWSTTASNYVDLTSQPGLGMQRHRSSPGSGSGRVQSVDVDGGMSNRSRPPRASPPPIQHAKSDSASTAHNSYSFAISPGSSVHGHGIDTMSSTHEGYVTAPQSVESSPGTGNGNASNGSISRTGTGTGTGTHTYSTPVQRFRVMNPDPARSPSPPDSPSPPPVAFNHVKGPSLSSGLSVLQKGLPPTPSSPALPPIPSSGSASAPLRADRQSSISSTKTTPPASQQPVRAPVRTTTSTSSSSHRSHTSALAPALEASSSPSSSSSAVSPPSSDPNEEPESFFVRNTYAQLDVTGVKGDGYAEGVERTRAKLGHDRRSVQLALRNDAKGPEEVTGDLADEELKILGSVDRYGFFSTPSHDRIVILPASTLSKPLHPITQTSTSSPPSPPVLTTPPKPPPVFKELESRRISKWGRMLEAERRDCGGNVAIWTVKPSKEKKLRSRVFKGIPDAWRAAAWEVLVARYVGKKKQQSLDAKRLEEMLKDMRREYRSSLDRPSSYDVQIDLDVPRTISGHVMFKTRYGQGQRSLFHTLHSFSLVCQECGYCQGMGPLAATLLCYYEPEKVYSFLVHFHDEYEIHDIFLPGFPGLLEAIYVQERIMERMLPGVYASFKKHMISTTSYATKWYITLFANTVPFQTQLRLWDAFLLEGRDLFVIMAVAIVWVLRDHLTSAQASFETVLSLLSSFFVPEDEDALLKWIDRALDDKKLRADMGGWRKEWQGLVKEKKEGGVLL